jgi:3-methyladenine DNA glycosylase AlkD
LTEIVLQLWNKPEREYQYAACDLLAKFKNDLPPTFLEHPLKLLISSKSWWDTIDSLETAAVVPLIQRNPELVSIMWDWIKSDNLWLVRTAIQHQRGLKHETDLSRLYQMCDHVVASKEFFIVKAIGWALRDCCKFDKNGVRNFLKKHSKVIGKVAVVEANRGLNR